jgi:hypothetical protein
MELEMKEQKLKDEAEKRRQHEEALEAARREKELKVIHVYVCVDILTQQLFLGYCTENS